MHKCVSAMKQLTVKIFLLLSLLPFGLQAQQIPASTSLPDVISGQPYSFANQQNKKAVVVLFTSSYCPYSRLYEERIQKIVNEFSAKPVAFVFVNPNNSQEQAEDSDASMKAKMKEWNLNLPYLRDENQQLARSLNASKTPEVFVLKPNGSAFQVVYSGAIDDNPQVAFDVSHPYLRETLQKVLAGAPVPAARHRPVGCMIKMENQ